MRPMIHIREPGSVLVQADERVETGIEGLDRVLKGGLIRSRTYILQGRPGAGKTILANHICFHHAKSGGTVLYVTLLAESHARLIGNLSELDFFDAGLVPSGVSYISGHMALRDGGLDGLVGLLRDEIGRMGTTLLVLDGLLNVRESAPSDLDLKVFLQQLQTHGEFANCTVLLLTSANLGEVAPEHTMVDGVIALSDDVVGARAVRTLSVSKFRGGAHLRGLHQFQIQQRGIVVHPRFEAEFATPSVPDGPGIERTVSGVPDLDAMIGGGLPARALTLAMGPSGTGKTTLALQFIASSSAEEPGLFFGFYETQPRLETKAASIGLDLSGLFRSGALEMLWQPPTENLLDGLAHRLREAVLRRGVKRLVIDGFSGFQRAAGHPDRIEPFFTALSNELRALGVTTFATWELREMIGPVVYSPAPEFSSIVENLILMRFVEYRAQMRRLISILKMRDSQFDARIREFQITSGGIVLADTFDRSEDLTTGAAHMLNRNDNRGSP